MAQRIFDRGTFAVNEIERNAHRLEREQQIRKQDRGVHFDAANRLQRDLGGEIGRAADLEQRIPLAQRPVLAHVPSRLSHEPDRRGVDRLPPAGFQESAAGCRQWVTLSRLRARPTRSSSHSGLKRSSAPRSRSSARDRVVEEIVAGDNGDGDAAVFVVRTQAAQKSEAVEERHPQVEDDGVRVAVVGLLQAGFAR